MQAANEDYDYEVPDAGATALAVHFLLLGGAALLAFLGWLLTL
jgi:hypothetical protein